MKSSSKQILVVGDRILIRPDTGEKKSPAGLYLPPSVIEKQEVRGGLVVEVGQGTIEHAKFKKSGDQKTISEEKIYTSTIDLLIPQQAKKTIRFFHIDVEGFEMDVLAGSEMTINAALYDHLL